MVTLTDEQARTIADAEGDRHCLPCLLQDANRAALELVGIMGAIDEQLGLLAEHPTLEDNLSPGTQHLADIWLVYRRMLDWWLVVRGDAARDRLRYAELDQLPVWQREQWAADYPRVDPYDDVRAAQTQDMDRFWERAVARVHRWRK